MKADVTEVLPVIGTSGGIKDLFLSKDEPLRTATMNCLESHQRCEYLIAHGLTGAKPLEPAHLALLRDCSQICLITADFMIRESRHHVLLGGACAEICRACADMCDTFTDDESMKHCAEACRRSAESCASAGMT